MDNLVSTLAHILDLSVTALLKLKKYIKSIQHAENIFFYQVKTQFSSLIMCVYVRVWVYVCIYTIK